MTSLANDGRRTIVFSHANGFPAGTYRLLFEAWRAAGWQVFALDKFGHDPAWPISSNWPQIRDQLIAFVEAHSAGRPVYLVGHSLGGFLSLLAASKRPALARGVILLDSPVLGGWRAHSVHMMKLSGLMERVSPGRVSAKRRWQWPSAEAAYAHFAAKTAFARWDPAVLHDYIDCGTEPDPEARLAGEPAAVRLAFRRDIETRLYNTLPHNMDRSLHRHPPRAPVAYIAGTRSAEGRQAGLAATRALVQDRMHWIEGSHLYPMERPHETAAAVLAQLEAWEALAEAAMPPHDPT
jgi:pimeloyl-ACP methyl ester carboxylesterase